MRSLNALNIAHGYIKEHVQKGDLCIDATMGRGRDTALLAKLVGDTGKVIAFDIQPSALSSTEELLKAENTRDRVDLILDSHANMANYAEKESVDCITFNLGWLPGGDHSVFTNADSSISAIKSALNLIKIGGIITVCIYYGKDCGYTERDMLLEYLPTIDYKKYSVLISNFANHPNDPPIPCYIRREK